LARELAEKDGGFQIESPLQARQDKEHLCAGVATLRQQIPDLGRNAEQLESEIARLKK
jgi:hypothetical protein